MGSAEIICVGTELLLGDILNSNSQYLAQQFADLGIAHYYQTVVGDNPQRIHQAIATACERSQLLIFTGGLGPTPDDLTTEAITHYFETPLVEHPDVLADIAEKFARRGREMAPSNRKQALQPQGAQVLPNPVGTAPGMIWQAKGDVLIMTFPGVPTEMRAMWQETAVPYLRSHGWSQSTIQTRTLKFWGISESTLAEMAGDFLAMENPTVAPYANHGVVKLRIGARAENQAAAIALIEPVEEQLKKLGGIHYFGNDDDTLAIAVGQLLKQRGETVAVAESCTGGGIGHLLTTIPGSSTYFWGGIISYDNRVKVKCLGVSEDTLTKVGAVSAEVAEQMAVGARESLGTTWGISVTGIAGPGGGSEEKPVGLVYVGIAGPKGVAHERLNLGETRSRQWIRNSSACSALDLLRRSLLSDS
ncbi:MAG: competence/damage-inducible protein A [Cyanobacteria bacterium P01_C01_bin.89]